MLEVEKFIFGPFETNTYVVSSFPPGEDGRGFVLIIDPACSNDYERRQLQEYISKFKIKNYELQIVATHGHLDHLWGAKWATEQWHTPVLIPEADLPMVEHMQQQYDLFGIPAKAEAFPMENLKSEIINIQSQMSNLELLETPGHTPGSVSLYFPEEKILFSGDTLFCMGYGRTDLPGGNTAELIASLQTLFALPADVQVYPGHGQRTTIGAERR